MKTSESLQLHRDALLALASGNGVKSVRVFGSMARNDVLTAGVFHRLIHEQRSNAGVGF